MEPITTRENSIPRKSERYYLGEAVIRSQFNDVEFYFEDECQQEMYNLIMQKLFGDRIKFEKIFVTCGKTNAYTLLAKHRNSKKKIFILDKDFDDLLRLKKRGVNNLFYLSRYSIENFLIEEEALKSLIISRKPTLNRNTVSLPYRTLIVEVMQELRSLTCYIFVAKKHKIPSYIQGFKTCKSPLEQFLINDKSSIDNAKSNGYWQLVEQAIIAHIPTKNPSDTLESAKNSINYNRLELDGVGKHIPGKYFLDLLKYKICKLYPFITKVQAAEMKYALAEKCNFESLNTLKNEINSFLEAA